MELFNEILTAIGTVGFPIVISIMLLLQLNEDKKARIEETKNLQSVLDNNTNAVEQLAIYIKELSGIDKRD